MQEQDDFKYYLEIVRRRWLAFIGVFLVVLLLAVVASVAIPPIYRSEAKILVESQQIPSELVKSTVGGMADERIAITRQRITARDELVDIIDKYNLFPERRKSLNNADIVELMRDRIQILPFDLALTGRRAREGSTAVAFTVGFDYEQPEVAAKVANELVTLILNEDIRNRTSKASETTQFLERESNRLQQELMKVDEGLARFKQTNYDALPERIPLQTAALQRAETNVKDIDREINDLAENKRLLGVEISLRKATQMPGTAVGGGDNPLLQLEQLRAELAQKSALYSDKHPEIKALKGQIKAIENQSEAALKAASDSDKTNIDKSQLDINSRIIAEKIETIDRQIAEYKKQKDAAVAAVSAINELLGKAPDVQNRLNQMERQADSLQKALDDINQKLATARLGEQLERDQQAERFEVIEQPITPQEPIRPNRKRIIAAGAGAAAALAAGLVAILELLNQSIKSSRDIVRALGRHPIGVIPVIGTQDESKGRLVRMLVVLVALLLVLILAVAALHFLFMPIDILMVKIMSRLGL